MILVAQKQKWTEFTSNQSNVDHKQLFSSSFFKQMNTHKFSPIHSSWLFDLIYFFLFSFFIYFFRFSVYLCGHLINQHNDQPDSFRYSSYVWQIFYLVFFSLVWMFCFARSMKSSFNQLTLCYSRSLVLFEMIIAGIPIKQHKLTFRPNLSFGFFFHRSVWRMKFLCFKNLFCNGHTSDQPNKWNNFYLTVCV